MYMYMYICIDINISTYIQNPWFSLDFPCPFIGEELQAMAEEPAAPEDAAVTASPRRDTPQVWSSSSFRHIGTSDIGICA